MKNLTTKDTKESTKVHKGKTVKMNREQVFKKVLDSSFKIHTELGPGLLESAYEECLYYELIKYGIKVEKQKGITLSLPRC